MVKRQFIIFDETTKLDETMLQLTCFLNNDNRVFIECGNLNQNIEPNFITLSKDDVSALINELTRIWNKM